MTMKMIQAFLRDESGFAAIDWIVVTAAMIVGLVIVVVMFRDNVFNLAVDFNAGLKSEKPATTTAEGG
jgi:Flp pilus assembly pilin Flp